MGYDFISVLELCAICGLAFWFVTFVALMLGVRMARREFRSKGFLKPPSGTHWFRFLFVRHYDRLENSSARFFFEVARFCLIVTLFSLGTIVILLVCELVLSKMGNEP
ncbi:MAG TPA: hypothetical protein VGZ93_06395 [Candidatus Methylacidiphilales bacterium]|jgi:hypothetical protein|nr:hypothetical protein [Candidatus Methylacidiphilales bacterium]